ncbi:MAG: PQQ-binding-like beta-propeller repeat protein, partial [Thermoplasmata archaeon]|nr:PQQ-binding-like beta-propeller repeat protein [Thermoplasmata archaeon]
GLLYAVNPDGSEKWQAEMTSSYLGTPALGPDGTIYVPCNFNDLIAVNPQGSIKWIFTLTEKPEAIYSTPSVGNDGTIYIGCDEHLFAINPDGTIKWKTRLTSDRHPYDKCHIVASPAIAEDGTIYISTWFLSGGSGVTDWGYLHAIGGVKIQQPEQGNLYLFGKRIIKTLLGNTIIIGPIDVQVSLFKEDIERVDFYVDWILKSTDTTSPFNWTWDLRSLIRHRHTIEVVAYDEDGEWAHDRMNVWKFL